MLAWWFWCASSHCIAQSKKYWLPCSLCVLTSVLISYCHQSQGVPIYVCVCVCILCLGEVLRNLNKRKRNHTLQKERVYVHSTTCHELRKYYQFFGLLFHLFFIFLPSLKLSLWSIKWHDECICVTPLFFFFWFISNVCCAYLRPLCLHFNSTLPSWADLTNL